MSSSASDQGAHSLRSAKPRYRVSDVQWTDERVSSFWKRVDRKGDDECWDWLGYRLKLGYGQVCVGGGKFVASRVAYFLHRGVDPGELMVCHKCDRPPCCNPGHTFLGTVHDNADDMIAKGRHRSGPRRVGETKTAMTSGPIMPSWSDLTRRQAEILAFIADTVRDCQRPPSLREIGDRFGISSTNGVADHLTALERKGRIVRDKQVSRGIRVVQSHNGQAIP